MNACKTFHTKQHDALLQNRCVDKVIASLPVKEKPAKKLKTIHIEDLIKSQVYSGMTWPDVLVKVPKKTNSSKGISDYKTASFIESTSDLWPKLMIQEPPGEYSTLLTSEIQLTEKEENIFAFLMDIVKENNLNTTVRVAGGWVRDKLCGKENNDIDLALDDMNGRQFADHINKKFEKMSKCEGFEECVVVD